MNTEDKTNLLYEMALHAESPKFMLDSYNDKWMFTFNVKSSNPKNLLIVSITDTCDSITKYEARIYEYSNSEGKEYHLPIYGNVAEEIIRRVLDTNHYRSSIALENSCAKGALKEFVKKN